MLCLSFTVAGLPYALPARRIVKVLPCLGLRPLPRAPDYVAGLLDYLGRPVPILDLGLLAGEAPCKLLLSTRIILLNPAAAPDPSRATHPSRSSNPKGRLLGLMAEQATDTLEISEADLSAPGLSLPDAPFLGRLADRDGKLVQLVEPSGLLLGEVRELLQLDSPKVPSDRTESNARATTTTTADPSHEL